MAGSEQQQCQAQPRAPVPSRRQVAVLFLDVVGSTALTQRLDPEDVVDVIDDLLWRCTAQVQAQGGQVLQYAGDSLLAAFGTDAVREDDAERAVRAGLALLDEGRACGVSVAQRHGHAGFGVRVGIHAGPVLLGGGIDAEASIRGITVNIAARMEQTAPPGALRISHDTWRLVRGVFDVVPQEPLAVKGVDQPVRSVLVRGVLPRAFRRPATAVDGLQAPLIGRDADSAALDAALQRVLDARQPQALTLVAEPGLGKTRLLADFQDRLELRATPLLLLHGRATAARGTQPYGVLRELLCSRFEIADSLPLDEAQARFAQALQAASPATEAEDTEGAAVLAQLLGLGDAASPGLAGVRNDGAQLRRRGFIAAQRYLRALTAASPVLLLVEDLHWADDGSLDFLQHLLPTLASAPLLLLCTARAELLERRPSWGDVTPTRQLQPLSAADAETLARGLLAPLGPPPSPVHTLLTRRAGGNPLFMEALLQMLIDDGVVDTAAEPWTLHPARLVEERVPHTLANVLQARLDRLPAPERLVLQQASVVGPVFWDEVLLRLSPDGPAAMQALQALAARGLTVPHPDSAFAPAREFGFHHQLLQQVAYDSVLRRQRATQHQVVARWLEERCGDRRGGFLGLIAYHHDAAGDAAAACAAHIDAGRDALRRAAADVAAQHARRALELAEAAVPTRLFDALLLHIRSRLLGPQPATLEPAVERLLALAQGLDAQARIEARLCRNVWLSGLSRFEAAEDGSLAVAADTHASPAQRADALHLAGWSALRRGRLDAACEHAQACRDTALAHGLRGQQAQGLHVLAVAAVLRGELVHALGLTRRCADEMAAVGNRASQLHMGGNAATMLIELGLWDEALPALRAHQALAQQLQDPVSDGLSLANQVPLLLARGDTAAAVHAARQALAQLRLSQNADGEAFASFVLAQAEAAAGSVHQAQALLEDAVRLFDAAGMPYRAVEPMAAGAAWALDAGRPDRARDWLERLLARHALGTAVDGLDQPLRFLWTCHLTLRKLGDPAATAWLQAAREELQRRAARIERDDYRRAFLDNIPWNRAIAAAA